MANETLSTHTETHNSALSYMMRRRALVAANETARELEYQGFTSLVVLVEFVGHDQQQARVSQWFAPADAARTISDHEMPVYFSWGLDDDGEHCYLPDRGE